MIDLNEVVITVEKDVPRSKKRSPRTINLDTDPNAIKLRGMEIGDSFFIQDAERKDARPLIALGKKVGVSLMAREVAIDEIYQTQGVRLWRVEPAGMRPGRGNKPPIELPKKEVDEDEDF